MSPAVYAVFVAFGTFFFLIIAAGFIYFAVQLMNTIRSATRALEMIGPLLKGEELTRLCNAFILMGKQGAEMLKKMEALDKTISLFYTFAVARGELDASTRVASAPSEEHSAGGGRWVGYSEERAAAKEAAVEAQEQR